MNLEYSNEQIVITEDNCNLRADKAIIFHESIPSRSSASKLFHLGLVKMNNKNLKPSYITQVGDIIDLKIPQAAPSTLIPYDLPLDVVYQDDDVIVINKPSGLVMHPSAGHHSDTLVNALLNMNIKLSMGFNEQRPGIVHRIDKDTSGLVVVAKNNLAHEFLAEQFKEKSVHRVYYAIAHDDFKKPKDTITTYLIRHPKDRKKYSIERLLEDKEPTGKLAITHYEALDYAKGLSLVRCQLETGRTHQIRVHLAENHHPIISDPIYSSSRWVNKIKSKHVRNFINNLEGIGLHAKELGFIHPSSKEKLMFNSPLPNRFIDLINFLGWSNE